MRERRPGLDFNNQLPPVLERNAFGQFAVAAKFIQVTRNGAGAAAVDRQERRRALLREGLIPADAASFARILLSGPSNGSARANT